MKFGGNLWFDRFMAASRNVVGLKDEEKLKEENSTAKKAKFERFPLSKWEVAAAFGIFLVCSTGLVCVYMTMPSAEYQSVKIPRTLSDLRMLKYVFLCSALFVLEHVTMFHCLPSSCAIWYF